MRKLFVVLLVFISSMTNGFAQDALNGDSLSSDFSYFVNQLEATHADPYSSFGGRVSFYIQSQALKDKIKHGTYTKQQFADELTEFISNLHDGHTFIHDESPDENDNILLPVGMKTINEDAIFSLLPAKYEQYLGSRIERINGVALDSILHKTSKNYACENNYGAYARLNQNAQRFSYYSKLFPNVNNDISFDIITLDGDKAQIKIQFINKELLKSVDLKKLPKTLSNKDYLSFKFIDDKKDIMLFKLASVMSHECFEVMLNQKMYGAYDNLKMFYQYMLNKEIPADTAQALAAIPSFSKTFYNMLQQMKANKSKVLIIDLRNNTGGWTPIILPSLYQMFGDEYLETPMNTKTYTRISPLWLRNNNKTLDEINAQYKTNYKLGDYILEDDGASKETNMDTLRHNFVSYCMSDTKDELAKQNGKPIYKPQKIYVITDIMTFSAAFHYAFYLWKMGATIVGVPSMQAPNTFMEVTPVELPYTKLSGSISNSMQLFLLANDRRANVFYPDITLSYKDYKKYKFDADAEILYLLDKEKY